MSHIYQRHKSHANLGYSRTEKSNLGKLIILLRSAMLSLMILTLSSCGMEHSSPSSCTIPLHPNSLQEINRGLLDFSPSYACSEFLSINTGELIVSVSTIHMPPGATLFLNIGDLPPYEIEVGSVVIPSHFGSNHAATLPLPPDSSVSGSIFDPTWQKHEKHLGPITVELKREEP